MHLRNFDDFIRFISQHKSAEKVLLRCDLNIPSSDDLTRIYSIKDTVLQVLRLGLKVVLISHYRRPKLADSGKAEFSLLNVVDCVSKVLERDVHFVETPIFDVDPKSLDSEISLLENLRFYKGEVENDRDFSDKLSKFADVYINDAFSVSHRSHASVVGIAERLPSFAGLSLQSEYESIVNVVSNIKHPFTSIVGGSKVSTKVKILQKLSKISDYLVIAGAMSNTFLGARGVRLGSSKIEPDHFATAISIMEGSGAKLVLPIDFIASPDINVPGSSYCESDLIPADYQCFDIGEKSTAAIVAILEESKTALWNGPTGAFEFEHFGTSSARIAKTLAELTETGKLVSIVGGGETVSALGKYKDKMSLVSTGGGAFLELVSGDVLPGIAVLEEK
jgi:phosphoglycerate kinase